MPSTGPGSVTSWIVDFKAGGGDAAQKLWNRYWDGLTRLARRGLRRTSRGWADEEDVALSAFCCLWLGAVSNRFRRLEDRHDLWRLLAVITLQKAVDQERRERRLKRGGHVPVEQLVDQGGTDQGSGLTAIAGREMTPELGVMMAEERQCLLDRLGDERLREIARSKMDGFTAAEIAGRMGCGLRTVERKLGVIRSVWLSTKRD